MKITITYKTYAQISPDDYEAYTKVVHCEENETLKSLHEKLTLQWPNKNFDAEIHFYCCDKTNNKEKRKGTAGMSEELKHTPGPWRIGDPNKNISEQEHEVIKGDKVLARGNNNFYDQSKADIALMAKAPEMLEMLIQLESIVSGFCRGENHLGSSPYVLRDKIRKIIDSV